LPENGERGSYRRLDSADWHAVSSDAEHIFCFPPVEYCRGTTPATTQPLSFYEVVWNEPGERVPVRDVLIGGETEVIERSGSRGLRPGDLLFAQIWYQPELAVFGSSAPIRIPPSLPAWQSYIGICRRGN